MPNLGPSATQLSLFPGSPALWGGPSGAPGVNLCESEPPSLAPTLTPAPLLLI